MTHFNVPTREEVSSNNQEIFDNLKKQWALFLTFMRPLHIQILL